jgi:hypothetical protein
VRVPSGAPDDEPPVVVGEGAGVHALRTRSRTSIGSVFTVWGTIQNLQ